MIVYKKELGFLLLTSLFFITFLSSCNPYHNIAYFRDVPDSLGNSRMVINTPAFNEPVIEYDDILSININTLDFQSNSTLNAAAATAAASSAVPSALAALGGGGGSPSILPASSTYRVDKSGIIELPLIGEINVLGYTTTRLADTIKSRVAVYYKTPTVDVRFTNYKVTVLGEVARPGTYAFTNEKVSVLDVLGVAGDLTVFAKRENVMLIRDSLGQKEIIRLNLNSKALISSQYFFIRKNDVFYVEPSESKVANLDAVRTRNYAIISAVASFLVILATRIK